MILLTKRVGLSVVTGLLTMGMLSREASAKPDDDAIRRGPHR
jgi:hypothetical protein